MQVKELCSKQQSYDKEMGEGEISPFIYLSLGGILEYDREELETFQVVLRCGRAQPAVAASPHL